MRAIEAVLADKIYNRIISDGYYRPTYGSPYYRPYYPPYRGYYLPYDLEQDVWRVLRYHDYVDRYDVVNKVMGHTLDPKLKEVLEKMYDMVHNKKGEEKKEEKKADAPAAKTLLETEGVPVLVDPALADNKMAYTDLKQRDYIIDGVSGIGFV